MTLYLISSFLHGAAGAIFGKGGNPSPVARGACTGWNARVAARVGRFLWGLDFRAMLARGWEGHTLTLTYRDVPTVEQHKRIRHAYMVALRRMGVTGAWVGEYQRRGVVHLHLILFTKDGGAAAFAAVDAWLRVAGELRPSWRGQHVSAITDYRGWLLYLTKHAARGVWHYQRKAPEGWEQAGQMWGVIGREDLAIADPNEALLTPEEWARYRRYVVKAEQAAARGSVPRQLYQKRVAPTKKSKARWGGYTARLHRGVSVRPVAADSDVRRAALKKEQAGALRWVRVARARLRPSSRRGAYHRVRWRIGAGVDGLVEVDKDRTRAVMLNKPVGGWLRDPLRFVDAARGEEGGGSYLEMLARSRARVGVARAPTAGGAGV